MTSDELNKIIEKYEKYLPKETHDKLVDEVDELRKELNISEKTADEKKKETLSILENLNAIQLSFLASNPEFALRKI